MTVTVLVSVSLLALVSTARPIPRLDDDINNYYLTYRSVSDQIYSAVQAVIASLPEAKIPKSSVSKDSSSSSNLLDEHSNEDEDLQVHVLSPETQEAVLSSLEDASVRVLIPLGEDQIHSEDEVELYNILTRLEDESGRLTPVPDDALETHLRLQANVIASEPEFENNIEGNTQADTETHQSPTGQHPMSIPVLLVSCLAALLLFMTVAAALTIIQIVREHRYTVISNAWDLLSRVERSRRRPTLQTNDASYLPPTPPLKVQTPLSNPEKTVEKSPPTEGLLVDTNIVVGKVLIQSESPTIDEKCIFPLTTRSSEEEKNLPLSSLDDDTDDSSSDIFTDALENESNPPSVYATPLISVTSLPDEETEQGPQSPTLRRFASSNSLTVPSLPTTPIKRPSQLRRTSRSPSPTPHISAESHQDRSNNPGTDAAREPSRAEVNRALDTALAMQLRPGLGLGTLVDAAWLVRFVMTFFGYFAILISGRRPR